MRPLRVILALVTCFLAFLLLLSVGPWRAGKPQDLQEQSQIGTYFNWHTPSSLFPPSAIISLTDDNSTFFLARPAAFGPLIPAKSLSGQLWIGSGFGDDHLGRSGTGTGELGCSDVPGWTDGGYVSSGKSLHDAKTSWAEGPKGASTRHNKRDGPYDEEDDDEEDEEANGPVQSDGTDDHLHHPLPPSDGLRNGGVKKATHADIQSLQESAEIAGKVVLLSRGGCGFLEKVKWVQRRGGVALIVGDDIRGGPLVTMYARGDTSNVTIPSLFTSHTTAHLLSSLIPSGRILGNISPEEAARLGLSLGDNSKDESQRDEAIDQPNFTTTSAAAKPTPVVQAAEPHDNHDRSEAEHVDESKSKGWLSSIFGKSGSSSQDSQPPTGGKVGWVLQEEFDDEEVLKYGKKQTTTTTPPVAAPSVVPAYDSGDGFVIGVQDWRDPDLVAHQREQQATSVAVPVAAESGVAASHHELKVDSITPGSGEYAKSLQGSNPGTTAKDANHDTSMNGKQPSGDAESRGWLGRLFDSADDEHRSDSAPHEAASQPASSASQPLHDHPHTGTTPKLHEGLWVTLTPTSMSTSPLFDTLLVLVVSPLVTLTIVYALLLLRSRIRRRRWRAPKSVVERLPVRTYQTMASTTTSSSTTSSISSPVTATTPLLPSNARPINTRSRPRSRTTPEGPAVAGSSLRSDGMASPSPEQMEEKRAAGLSEWRRRYGGKQRECVVCLEEYIDGVSRVMSLPCGHEFHAECITPWLTTRRRTCPICKGDVVRSLARSSNSNSNSNSSTSPPQTTPYHDDVGDDLGEDSDEIQEQAAVTRNDDPAAAQPVSREDEMFEDLERGVGPDRTR